MRDERTTRLCTKCGIEKPTDRFPVKVGSNAQGHRQYRSHVCRDCHNTQNREWFAKHRAVSHANNRRYWDKADPRFPERLARHRKQAQDRRLLNYAFADAEKAYLEALGFYKKFAEKNPTVYQKEVQRLERFIAQLRNVQSPASEAVQAAPESR